MLLVSLKTAFSGVQGMENRATIKASPAIMVRYFFSDLNLLKGIIKKASTMIT
jgi:hypothetical protein